MKIKQILIITSLLHALAAFVVPDPPAAQPIEFDGLIEPYMEVKVCSGVAGVLDSVRVDRGDMVKEGQVVATLQSDVEKATVELTRAKAEMESAIKAKREALEYAARKLERNQDLYRQKAIPDQQWDEVETERRLAENGLAEALENKQLARLELNRAIEVVKRMEIRSPLTGVVVERFLHPGEYAEDQPILKLAQIHPLNVEVVLPVGILGSVKIGMRATVKPEAPVSGFYTATVKIVDRVVDAASGTFGVRLELPNPDYQLPPGLKCKVVFLESEPQAKKQRKPAVNSQHALAERDNERPEKADQLDERTASPTAKGNMPSASSAKPTAQAKTRYHEVQSGESLSLIAGKYGLSVNELCRLNNINPRRIIKPGQKLLVTP